MIQKTQQIGIISSPLVDETQLDLKSCTVILLGHLQEEMITKIKDGGLDSELGNVVVKSVTELALKSVLNAISTGAHIAKGKVYQNFMVDLRLR